MRNSLRLLPSGPDRVGEAHVRRRSPATYIPFIRAFCKVAWLQAAWQFLPMQHITPNRPNTFTGGSLDRAGHRRDDKAWLDAAMASPASQFVLFWRGKAMMTGLAGNTPRAAFMPRPAFETPWVFIGLQDDVAVFAADLSALEAPPQADDFAELMSVAGLLPADDGTILATARGMLHWRTRNAFCADCGAPNLPIKGGYVMQCTQCGTEHFPRSDPAVIMLVEKDGKLLLGQSHRFPPERNWFSTLAGFVEPGESLEDAVRREVFEEVGVRVGKVVYHSSQPWPFPASLMVGFYAEGLSDEIVLEAAEMRDARWFSAAEIANREALGFDLPGGFSIARRLIDDWLQTHS